MGGLGPLSVPLWVVLGRSSGLCGRSRAALGAYVGGLGQLLESWASAGGSGPLLGPMLAVLGRSWTSAGSSGPLLGPMLAVLGCSCASAGDPGSLLGPILAVLGRSWDLS